MEPLRCPRVAKPYPQDLVHTTRQLLVELLASVGDGALLFADQVMRLFPVHARQAEEVAADLDLDARKVFLANLSYDLTVSFGCSTMALAAEQGPILARNMDWPNEQAIARASCIVELASGWNAGFIGSVGVVTALSRHGFALALNAVLLPEPNLDGYPMLLFLRKVLDEAADFEEAVAMLAREPLASGGLITVVGTDNQQRVVVERTPTRGALRRAQGDQPLLTTNHFQACLHEDDFCPRLERLRQRAPRLSTRPTTEELLDILRDEEVRQSITAQHIIAQPATQQLDLFVPAELLG